jgi:single-strand DNA-binding protein
MSFNKIILVGNLGKDPELRYTPQGTAVCSFSLATNEKRKDRSGEYQNIATWFKVTLWGNTAENAAKYLVKGTPVYIEGRLRIEEWTDREGNNRQSLEVNGTEMQFIAAREHDNSAPGAYGYGGGHSADFPTHSGPASAGVAVTPQPSLLPAPGGAARAPIDDDIPF